jgi:hypothetical protein
MSDLFSSLILIFTIIKAILSTFLFTVSKFYKHLVKWALTEIEWSVAGTTTLDREWFTIICQNLIIQHSIDWFSELPRYHRNLLFLTFKMDAVVRIADHRLVNILWLKIMHWIWRKGSAEVVKIIFSLGYITVFIYFW